MRPFPLHGEDAKPDSPVSKIIAGALGKATILDSAPTQAANTIQEGEAGFYGTKLYFTISGTLYEVSLTQTA